LSPHTRTHLLINLTVHGVGATVRELEPGEDEVWITVEQLELVLDAVRGRSNVRITVDDSNASDVEILLPRLLSRGLTAEFFVIAGMLGAPGRLTVDGVGELLRAGMAVGSHGWAHRDWRRLDAAQAGEEYREAMIRLTDLTGRPVNRVAIPFGSYDRHVLRALRRAGVSRVFTSDGGTPEPDAWLQPRNSLHHDLDGAWAENVLSNRCPVRTRARRAGSRLYKRHRGRP